MTTAPSARRRWRTRAALVALGGGAAAFAALYFGLDEIGLSALARRRVDLAGLVAGRPALSATAFVAAYAATTAIALPGAAALTVIGGFLFGAGAGAALAALGATAGGATLFLAASTLFGRRLRARAGPRLGALMAGFRADAASYMLALRLAPVFPFWLVNLAAATAGVRFSTFLWTTAIGIVPATFAFALGGAGLESTLQALATAEEACGRPGCAGRLALSSLISGQLAAALLALGALALAPAMVHRWRAWRRPTPL